MPDSLSLFESIDLEWIHRCVTERRQEDLHLDFKTVNDDQKLHRDDRRNLAKVITGFANADGGIAVWGVVARKDKDGVDCATELKPVGNMEACLSQFNSLTHQAAEPVVDGVQHKAIPDAGKSGYLVTYVPASEAMPHESKLGEHRYWKRAGDSFCRIERYELEALFGRRRAPALSVFTAVKGVLTGGGAADTIDPVVVVGLRNTGYGIARFPYLALNVAHPYGISRYGLDGNYNPGLPRTISTGEAGSMTAYGGGADHVVHIDSHLDVTAVRMHFKASATTVPDLRIEYRITAEGIRPKSDIHTMTGDEIVAQIREQLPDAFPNLKV